MIDDNVRRVARVIAPLVHKDNWIEAAKLVAEACRLRVNISMDNTREVVPILQNFVKFLLDNGGAPEAASILWTANQFTHDPQSVKDIFNFFDESNQGLIMGAASMSKSYSLGVRLMLEWIRDPEYTSVKVIGPTEAHLEQNLFSHLITLHDSAKLPLPGETGNLYIGINRRNQYSSIRGVVIPIGQNKKSGRLQGTKRQPRKTPHPIFGPLSRLFVFIDEFENVPQGIWKDIDNVVSQIEGEGNSANSFKIFGAFNPSDQSSPVAHRAKPVFGWENFDVDTHYRWRSERGWNVLRLDGEKCENVVRGEIIYPGLQTRIGLEKIALNAGGRESPGYYTMGRGAYPPTGVQLTIIPPGMLACARGEFVWYETPAPCGAVDLALEGGASCVFTLGKLGLATGIKHPPTPEFPAGYTTMFKDPSGNTVPRWGLLAEYQFVLPKGDTLATKDEILKVCRRAGIKPELFSIDRTGIGQGVSDLIKNEWGAGIHAVNFSESCTDGLLMEEDTKKCNEEYDRIQSELWFGLRAWLEFQYCLIAPGFDLTILQPELTQRKFRQTGIKKKAESKKDYMTRGFTSPDRADSLTLLVFAARRGRQILPSMRGTAANASGVDDGWSGIDMVGGAFIDASNRNDYL